MLWTISTTGFTLSKHYCGDILVSVTINNEAKSCCDSESGCCHNENERFEVKDDFISAQEIENVSVPEHEILFPVIFSYISNIPLLINYEITNNIESHPPPQSKAILSELQKFLC
jgi:hypothetical protein